MSLWNHPGFIAYEGGGFEVLHADWPAYPSGHGWRTALAAIAAFPSGIRFRKLDEIDKCLLFVAAGTGPCLEPKGDLYDTRWFHIAAWIDDIEYLAERGFISGALYITEYEDALDYYEKHRGLHTPSGEPINLPKPFPEDFDEDARILRVTEEGLTLTEEGTRAVAALARPISDLIEDIRVRAEPLLQIPFHDSAVREAGVVLESRVRQITGSTSFGQALVEEYYKFLCTRSGGTQRAAFKILRGELRTLFKFVRNDFAHALRDITRVQCLAILDRMSSAIEAMDQIEETEPT